MPFTSEYEVGEKLVAIEQRADETEEGGRLNANSGTVWDAALVLVHYLTQDSVKAQLEGKRGVDLGCGTGVVGICAASLGMSCVLTDYPEVCTLAEANVQRNRDALEAACTVSPLDWNDATLESLESLHLTRLDYILCSDLVCAGLYASAPLVVLLHRLLQHGAPGAVCLMAYEQRPEDDMQAFLRALKEGTRWVAAMLSLDGFVKHLMERDRAARGGQMPHRAPPPPPPQAASAHSSPLRGGVEMQQMQQLQAGFLRVLATQQAQEQRAEHSPRRVTVQEDVQPPADPDADRKRALLELLNRILPEEGHTPSVPVSPAKAAPPPPPPPDAHPVGEAVQPAMDFFSSIHLIKNLIDFILSEQGQEPLHAQQPQPQSHTPHASQHHSPLPPPPPPPLPGQGGEAEEWKHRSHQLMQLLLLQQQVIESQQAGGVPAAAPLAPPAMQAPQAAAPVQQLPADLQQAIHDLSVMSASTQSTQGGVSTVRHADAASDAHDETAETMYDVALREGRRRRELQKQRGASRPRSGSRRKSAAATAASVPSSVVVRSREAAQPHTSAVPPPRLNKPHVDLPQRKADRKVSRDSSRESVVSKAVQHQHSHEGADKATETSFVSVSKRVSASSADAAVNTSLAAASPASSVLTPPSRVPPPPGAKGAAAEPRSASQYIPLYSPESSTLSRQSVPLRQPPPPPGPDASPIRARGRQSQDTSLETATPQRSRLRKGSRHSKAREKEREREREASVADRVVQLLLRQRDISLLQDSVGRHLDGSEAGVPAVPQVVPPHQLLGFSAAVFDASTTTEEAGTPVPKEQDPAVGTPGILRWPEDVQHSTERRRETGDRIKTQRQLRSRTRSRSHSRSRARSSTQRGYSSEVSRQRTRSHRDSDDGVSIRDITSELARDRHMLHDTVTELNAIVRAHRVTLASEETAWAAAEKRRMQSRSNSEAATSPQNRRHFADELTRKLAGLTPQR